MSVARATWCALANPFVRIHLTVLQCHLQLLSFAWTSSVFETCRHEILKGTFRLISSPHLCAIIDSRLLMCEWQYTKKGSEYDISIAEIRKGSNCMICHHTSSSTSRTYICLRVTHDGLVREYLNDCESSLIPSWFSQGMDESYFNMCLNMLTLLGPIPFLAVCPMNQKNL